MPSAKLRWAEISCYNTTLAKVITEYRGKLVGSKSTNMKIGYIKRITEEEVPVESWHPSTPPRTVLRFKAEVVWIKCAKPGTTKEDLNGLIDVEKFAQQMEQVVKNETFALKKMQENMADVRKVMPK